MITDGFGCLDAYYMYIIVSAPDIRKLLILYSMKLRWEGIQKRAKHNGLLELQGLQKVDCSVRYAIVQAIGYAILGLLCDAQATWNLSDGAVGSLAVRER